MEILFSKFSNNEYAVDYSDASEEQLGHFGQGTRVMTFWALRVKAPRTILISPTIVLSLLIAASGLVESLVFRYNRGDYSCGTGTSTLLLRQYLSSRLPSKKPVPISILEALALAISEIVLRESDTRRVGRGADLLVLYAIVAGYGKNSAMDGILSSAFE